MTAQDKKLDIIGKLFAKSESAQELGNIAEAEAFALKAQELLRKYQLEDEDLQRFLAEKSDAEVVSLITETMYRPRDWGHSHSAKRSAWKEQLASVIARANGCRILVMSGSNYIWFVGPNEAAEMSLGVYARMLEVFEKESQASYDREYNVHWAQGTTYLMRGYRASWIAGAVRGLGEKLREQAAAQVTSTALIRLTGAVDKYIEQKRTGKAAGLTGQQRGSTDGYMKGKAFGRSVSTRPELNR